MAILLRYNNAALPEKADWIWIHAICIDQESLAENSTQVGAMGAIFRSARRVLVWLGETSEHVALVNSDIDRVQRIYANIAEEPSYFKDHTSENT
jgi:hypothetical protein